MNKRILVSAVVTAGAVLLWSAARVESAADAAPGACVDCHVKGADADLRLSVIMAGLTKEVAPALLAKAQAAAPKGVKLKGKHPNVAAMIKSIPDGCLKCHTKTSKSIPALGQMLHLVHLTGGDASKFLKGAGTCASCHKLDETTGAQPIPSGAEK
jgi:cytochrome c553